MSTKRKSKGAAEQAAPRTINAEDLHVIRIVVQIDTSEIATMVNYQVMKRTDDERPETERLMEALKPIVGEGAMGLGAAIGQVMSGEEMLKVAETEEYPLRKAGSGPSVRTDRLGGRA